jgi:hypothetical protein
MSHQSDGRESGMRAKHRAVLCHGGCVLSSEVEAGTCPRRLSSATMIAADARGWMEESAQ